MKKIILIDTYWFYICLVNTSFLFANNVEVSNISTKDHDLMANTITIQFDVSWENSWRTSTLESNWDAVWVFVKYRKKNDEFWHHVTLNSSGHQPATGSTLALSPDFKGVFIHRDAVGSGNVNFTNNELSWDYGAQGLSDVELKSAMNIQVYAIEMVYVPQGEFEAGDGLSHGAFYTYPNTATPYTISSEAAISVGTNTGDLYYSTGGDSSGPIPAAYPKGYQAFYCMKYEITQEEYAQFLNTLHFGQQYFRIPASLTASPGALINLNGDLYRQNISIVTPASYTTVLNPAVVDVDYNDDNIFGDGGDIAAGFLSWDDLLAYLDWAALRPMTELEFEKACRGSETPISKEYAWGSDDIFSTTLYTRINDGLASEGFSDLAVNNGNAAVLNTVNNTGISRVGIFAASSTNNTRLETGATYYGIMEMTGNVNERVVNIGSAVGRSFDGSHGDGELEANGDANANTWTNHLMGGLKGGRTSNNINNTSRIYLEVSNRSEVGTGSGNRVYNYGGRGVRTSP